MIYPLEKDPLLQIPRRVTLRDLARELGLSDRAVSQALTPRESNVKLNPKTVERIRKLAQEKNYRPDSRARSMRYGRFYNIGYFEAKKTATAHSILGAESGVFDTASDNKYRVVLIRLPSEMRKDQTPVPSAFREGNLDALILSHAGNLTNEMEEVIDASGFPVIYLNEKKKTNAVYADDYGGAVKIIEHLISLGKRKIIYITESPTDHYSVKDRLDGYLDAMKKAQLPPRVLPGPGPSHIWDGGELLSLLQKPGEVDAVAAYNDYTAMRFYRILYKHPHLRSLPVTGFDDFGENISPVPLTTMKIPFYEMGRRAAEMALMLVNNNQKSIPAEKFPTQLFIRDSSLGK